MMTALCLAAKSGVDVRIMTPGIPGQKMISLTQSYYKQLLEAGVKIYEYQPGFFTCKNLLSVMTKVGVVGTIKSGLPEPFICILKMVSGCIRMM